MAFKEWDKQWQTEQKHICNAGKRKKQHRYYPVIKIAVYIPRPDTKAERQGIGDGTHDIYYQRVFRDEFVSTRKYHNSQAYDERYPRG